MTPRDFSSSKGFIRAIRAHFSLKAFANYVSCSITSSVVTSVLRYAENCKLMLSLFLFPQQLQRSHTMTTTVSVGMLPIVTLPRFVPSSAAVQSAPPSSYGQAAQWAAANGDTQGGGDLDFDLLAEYLLDDATAIDSNATGSVNANGTGMPQFDFR